MIEDGKGSEEHVKFSVKKPTGDDIELAKKISGWTQNAGNMIPKTPDDILELFQMGNSIVVQDGDGVDMSHAAITYQYTDNSVEVGALFTDEAHRGKGAGTFAAKTIVEEAVGRHPNQTIFALANESSEPIFKKLGKQMLPSELSDEVWEPCKQCPRNPQQLGKCIDFKCCDTPYNVTEMKK